MKIKYCFFSIVPAMVLFVGLECTLHVIGFQFNTWFLEQPVFEERKGGQFEVAAHFTKKEPYGFPFVLAQTVQLTKPKDVLRVVLFGGSSIFRLEHADPLQKRLESVSGKKVEIINMGFQGCGSKRLVKNVQESLKFDPDVFLIHTGNNDFVSFCNTATYDNGNGEVLSTSVLMKLKTVQLASKLSLTFFKPTAKKLEELDRQYSDVEKETVYKAFRKNIEQAITIAKRGGVKVVLGSIPYSYHVPPWGDKYRNSLDEISKLSQKELEEKLKLYPESAFVEYVLGLQHLARRDIQQAVRFFERSFLHDSRPIRANSAINEIVLNLANSKAIVLADVHKEIILKSPGGIPGPSLFSDHCHLNKAGNQIALDVFGSAIEKALASN